MRELGGKGGESEREEERKGMEQRRGRTKFWTECRLMLGGGPGISGGFKCKSGGGLR